MQHSLVNLRQKWKSEDTGGRVRVWEKKKTKESKGPLTKQASKPNEHLTWVCRLLSVQWENPCLEVKAEEEALYTYDYI